MNATTTTKRPLPEDVNSSPSSPTSKRAHSEINDASAEVGAGQPLPQSSRRTAAVRIPSTPFLPCHLTMLRSLYASTDKENTMNTTATGASSKTADNAVGKDAWNLIEVFLANRGDLSIGKGKAQKSRAVYESAVQILQIGGGSGGIIGGDSIKGIQSPVLFTPLSRAVPTPTRSVGVGTAAMNAFNAQHQQQQGVNSWALVTTLLGRRSAAVDKEAKVISKAFQPLVAAVRDKLDELQGIYKSLVNEWYRKEEDKAAVLLNTSPGNTGGAAADIDALQETFATKASLAAEEEDAIARLECKIRLWRMLLGCIHEATG